MSQYHEGRRRLVPFVVPRSLDVERQRRNGRKQKKELQDIKVPVRYGTLYKLGSRKSKKRKKGRGNRSHDMLGKIASLPHGCRDRAIELTFQ